MDERPVERINQTDDAIIDRAVHQLRNLNHSIRRGRQGERRDVRNRLVRLQRVGDEHPHIAVSFAARIRADANFVGLDR